MASRMAGRPAATAAALLALVAAVTASPATAATPPVVRQLVAFRDGSAVERSVRAYAASVRVRRRTCRVGAGTPLAALLRSRVGPLGVRDYGRCGARAVDAGGLFVFRLGADRNAGADGWVYKVGNRLATAGAADPDGPFGRGRLRRPSEVTWFYCRMDATGSCQRTLAVTPRVVAAGTVEVTVRAYSDAGHAIAGAGATVHLGAASAVADEAGLARFEAVRAGRHRAWAAREGAVRSFTRAVTMP